MRPAGWAMFCIFGSWRSELAWPRAHGRFAPWPAPRGRRPPPSRLFVGMLLRAVRRTFTCSVAATALACWALSSVFRLLRALLEVVLGSCSLWRPSLACRQQELLSPEGSLFVADGTKACPRPPSSASTPSRASGRTSRPWPWPAAARRVRPLPGGSSSAAASTPGCGLWIRLSASKWPPACGSSSRRCGWLGAPPPPPRWAAPSSSSAASAPTSARCGVWSSCGGSAAGAPLAWRPPASAGRAFRT
mmetsp:Transcript_130374/g.417041  ORF Transcript_130374/g.417041 Transcript_130374/m.417041 type:complete len:247 (-) Transcript_130374:477-1217(-)